MDSAPQEEASAEQVRQLKAADQLLGSAIKRLEELKETKGELPVELRMRIVQDIKAHYGEDYARMIKSYFEQIADTKKK